MMLVCWRVSKIPFYVYYGSFLSGKYMVRQELLAVTVQANYYQFGYSVQLPH